MHAFPRSVRDACNARVLEHNEQCIFMVQTFSMCMILLEVNMQSMLIKQSNHMKKRNEKKTLTAWIRWQHEVWAWEIPFKLFKFNNSLCARHNHRELRFYVDFGCGRTDQISINRFLKEHYTKNKTKTTTNILFILQACSEFRASLHECCAMVCFLFVLFLPTTSMWCKQSRWKSHAVKAREM